MPTIQQNINKYAKGTTITHELQIKQGGRFVAPSTINVFLQNPLGVQSGPFTPTTEGVGQYRYLQQTVLADATGVWRIRWVGTGIAQGSAEREYYIYSNFA